MASFEQHVNVAVISSGVIVAPMHSAGLLDINQSLIALGLGLIGGILPDLDSDNSKPVQIAFKMLSIFIPLIIVLLIASNIAVLYMLILWLMSTLLLHLVLFKMFLSMTTHRGLIHTLPMGILFGELTALFAYGILDADAKFSLISGFFIFFGFMVHLSLDELFSVNALGLRMKKSFGTALKLYDKNNKTGSLILYASIVVLFIALPSKSGLYSTIVDVLSNMKFI